MSESHMPPPPPVPTNNPPAGTTQPPAPAASTPPPPAPAPTPTTPPPAAPAAPAKVNPAIKAKSATAPTAKTTPVEPEGDLNQDGFVAGADVSDSDRHLAFVHKQRVEEMRAAKGTVEPPKGVAGV